MMSQHNPCFLMFSGGIERDQWHESVEPHDYRRSKKINHCIFGVAE